MHADRFFQTTRGKIVTELRRRGSASATDLARSFGLSPNAVRQQLMVLERDGLVATVADPADRRNRLIALTRAGRRKIVESERSWARAQERFEASFGVKESAALRRALAVIASDGFLRTFRRPRVG